MVAVNLSYTWVTLVSSGESVKGYTAKGRAFKSSKEGETRRLAGGRFRTVVTLGTRRTQSFALRDISLDDIHTLESWEGQLVLVRDYRGRKMYGTFFDVDYADGNDPNYYDVTLNVTENTHDEGV